MTPDKLSPGVAQVLTKKPNKKRPNRSPFRKMILSEDDNRCRGCQNISRLAPHHIIYLSQGGKDTLGNGITLCKKCHDDVHDGITVYGSDLYKGIRLTGRELMVALLDKLKSDPCWRWTEVYELLKRKVK